MFALECMSIPIFTLKQQILFTQIQANECCRDTCFSFRNVIPSFNDDFYNARKIYLDKQSKWRIIKCQVSGWIKKKKTAKTKINNESWCAKLTLNWIWQLEIELCYEKETKMRKSVKKIKPRRKAKINEIPL